MLVYESCVKFLNSCCERLQANLRPCLHLFATIGRVVKSSQTVGLISNHPLGALKIGPHFLLILDAMERCDNIIESRISRYLY
jgi:hypothetical protein